MLAICISCSANHKEGDKELKTIRNQNGWTLHIQANPTHVVQIIESDDTDRKTGFKIRTEKYKSHNRRYPSYNKSLIGSLYEDQHPRNE